jgi:Leucine-rich repeat (LRR) protein
MALFNLTSLHHLDLSRNNFGGSHLPAVGFERLSLLTYLNLSGSGLYGQIPINIGYFTSLLSLDLSNHFVGDISTYSSNALVLWEPSFTALLANLSNLRELYLDSVDISASGEEWCNTLARHVPHLEILSLEDCGLSGPIDHSLSRLRSLNHINLNDNYISGAVPDFFADFLGLSVLQLADCNFDGLIPPRIFQLKKLSVLDVSDNPNMLVHLPDFLNGSSLKILNMQGTNVSTTNPRSFSSLRSLEELSLDGKYRYIGELHPSYFVNLHKLHLSWLGSESQISWIGDLKKLTNLEIFSSNFSTRAPSWIGNLTSLTSLEIYDCIFSGSIPSAIENLKNLTILGLWDCGFSGRIPSWVANLTQLSVLDLDSNHLRGKSTYHRNIHIRHKCTL